MRWKVLALRVDAKSVVMIDGARLKFVAEGVKQDFQFERTDKPVWSRSAKRTVRAASGRSSGDLIEVLIQESW